MILKIKGHRINLKNASISKLQRVKKCLHRLKITSDPIKHNTLTFIMLIIDNKIHKIERQQNFNLNKKVDDIPYSNHQITH